MFSEAELDSRPPVSSPASAQPTEPYLAGAGTSEHLNGDEDFYFGFDLGHLDGTVGSSTGSAGGHNSQVSSSYIPQHRGFGPQPQGQSFMSPTDSGNARSIATELDPRDAAPLHQDSEEGTRIVSKDTNLLDPAFLAPHPNESDGPWNGRYGNRLAMAYNKVAGVTVKDGKTVPRLIGHDITGAAQKGQISVVQIPRESLEKLPDNLRSLYQSDASLKNASRTIDLGDRFKIAVKKDAQGDYDSDEGLEAEGRTGGPSTFIPPPGYVRVASEEEISMTWYDTDGPYSQVHSWAIPAQFPLSKLGSICLTLIELGVVSWRHNTIGHANIQSSFRCTGRSVSTCSAFVLPAATQPPWKHSQ